MLDFAATQIGQRVSHDSVVQVEQFHGRLITQRLSQCRGFHDVREENGPDSRVARIGFAARQDGCSRRIRLDIAEKSICELGLYLDNLSSDETVRFTVAGVCRFGIRCLDQTEDFPATFVNPVFQVVNAVLLLRFEISQVRFCDIFRANFPQFMNVHV